MTAKVNQPTQAAVSIMATLPPQVQQLLPVLVNLDAEQKLSVINVLTTKKVLADSHIMQKTNTQPKQKKLTPLDRQYFTEVWMSDDFDDYLGDDFWFGDSSDEELLA